MVRSHEAFLLPLIVMLLPDLFEDILHLLWMLGMMDGLLRYFLLHQAGLVFHRIQAIRQGHNLRLLQLNDGLQLGHLQEHELDVATQAAHPRITLRLVGGRIRNVMMFLKVMCQIGPDHRLHAVV